MNRRRSHLRTSSPADDMIDLHSHTRPQLEQLIVEWGFAPTHAARLWSYLYHERGASLRAMPDLPAKLQVRLQRETRLAELVAAREARSDDELARKYLLNLSDGPSIETVLMRYRDRATVCVSSQVGCALGCVFCATGQLGFTRDLTTGEIVAQAMFVDRVLNQAGERLPTRGTRRAAGNRLRNVVFMGMGEPLLNYDAVLNACDILHDPGGFAIGAKQITVSTVGVVPGILRLADEARPYSLAVSLHAATQAERAAVAPAARAWPLDALVEACRYYVRRLDRKIFFEWTLIEGVNDAPEQARAVAELLRGIPAQLNLIPLNPTRGYSGAPVRPENVARFQSILHDRGLPSTVRQRRGVDIAAGCGQLNSLAAP